MTRLGFAATSKRLSTKLKYRVTKLLVLVELGKEVLGKLVDALVSLAIVIDVGQYKGIPKRSRSHNRNHTRRLGGRRHLGASWHLDHVRLAERASH
jgi:hypothetical protein